ncbi:coiled-coil domain-containing protein 92 [Patella vulgata]|uniref:coiled-coil domain-containing protein 92 n=1 Tax=Patella vulgata TaxID=6465 RepID=UPI00217F278B|nr:coiled-coil domain-containing protein 92 [Patella vulgata]
MTSEAAIHKRNLESSILFMQQEHSDTLKGLHEEIQNLQKKCTDLTFQLTMHGLSIEESDDVSSKFSELKNQLDEKTRFIKIQETQLSEKDAKIKDLEQAVKAYKKKYLDEARQQTQIVNTLKADIETKSCTVAYLTSKLHQIKVQSKVDPVPENIIRRTDAGRIPAPPKEMLSKPRRIANVRRNPAVAGAETLSLHPVRLSSARSSSGSNRSNSPDISSFLSNQGEKLYSLPKPSILPPITTSQENSSVLVHQVVHPKKIYGHQPSTSEIATLAVEQLPHRRKSWGNPQESHSSEYK